MLNLKPASHKHKNEPSPLMHFPRMHTSSLLHSSTSTTDKKWGKKSKQISGKCGSRSHRLINSNYPHRSSIFSESTGSTASSRIRKRMCNQALIWTLGVLAIWSASWYTCKQETKQKRDLPQLFRLRTFPPDSLKWITNARCLISRRWVDNCGITA